MINLLRAEWIKLRTVTMNWVLGIIAIAFPLVVTLLNAFFAGKPSDGDDFVDGGITAADLVEVITGTAVVAAMLLGVIAAAAITSEFGFGTIRPTFAATPRRLKVITAKGLVVVTFATVAMAVVQLAGWNLGSAVAENRGSTINLDEVASGNAALVGAVVFTALLAMAGYAFGLITRSTPASIAILIVWPLIAENLIGGLLQLATDNEKVVNWMPFRSGFRLLSRSIADSEPSRLTSGVYFGAVVLGLTVLGGWLVNRRDA